jgi:hypothetical protein
VAAAPSPAGGGRGGADAQSLAAEAPRRAQRRPGLGTEFGEAVSSPVHEVEFARADSTRPSTILGARYNDREGLLALGIDVDGVAACCDEGRLRRTADPFPVVDRGYATPPPGWRP